MKANAQPEIVTKNGKPVSVILPIKKYQEMLERLEDAADVAWLKRARRKKLHFRPLEEMLADLPTRQAMYRVVVERSAEKGRPKTPARGAFPRRWRIAEFCNRSTPGWQPQARGNETRLANSRGRLSIRLSQPPTRQSVRRICIPTTQTSSAKVPLWEYLRISLSTRSKNSSGNRAA